MKTMNDEKSSVTSTFSGETQNFQADPRAIMLLIDKIYSNKIQVITQEYMSNARDAHREYKVEKGIAQSKRIKVKLPSRGNLAWSVRDYGIGIDDARMREVFTFIGRSTKRQNNKQTGGFGIGAKTGWAYKNAFLIRTYLDGVLTEYSAIKDSNNNATLQLLSQSKTNEENGTEIEIAVDEKDIDNFCKTSIRASFFWDESERPEFSNYSQDGNLFYSQDKMEFKKLNSAIVLKSEQIPHYVKPCDGHFLIIDGIPYPANNAIEKKLSVELKEIDQYLSGVFVISVKTGNLEVSATRESIEDDVDGKNVSVLKILYIDFIKELKKAIEQERESALKSKDLADSVVHAKSLMQNYWLKQVLPLKHNIYTLNRGSDRYTQNSLVLHIAGLKKQIEKGRKYLDSPVGINCFASEYTIKKNALRKSDPIWRSDGGIVLTGVAIIIDDVALKPIEKNRRIRSVIQTRVNVDKVYLLSDYEGIGFVNQLSDKFFIKLSEITYDKEQYIKEKIKVDKVEEDNNLFHYYDHNRTETSIDLTNDDELFGDYVYCLYSEYKNKNKDEWLDYHKMLPDGVRLILVTSSELKKIQQHPRFKYHSDYTLLLKRDMVLYRAYVDNYNILNKLFSFNFSKIEHLELQDMKDFKSVMDHIITTYPLVEKFAKSSTNNFARAYGLSSYKYLSLVSNSKEYFEIINEFNKINALKEKLEKNEYCALMTKMLTATVPEDVVYEFINYKIKKEIL